MMSNLIFQREETIIYIIEAPANATLKSINFFLVEHAEGVYLIDAGMDNDACWEAFMQVMQRHNYSISDLKGVILTHHHPDHVGLVHRIRKLNQELKVYAHPLAIPYITHDKEFLAHRISFFEKLYAEMDGMPEAAKQIEKFNASFVTNEAFRIDGGIELIQEGDTILDFTVLDVPGHAPDHILLYDHKRKWAIVGDLVIEHMSTNAIIEPDASGRLIPTVTQQLQSLRRCLSLDVNVMFAAHGKLVDAPKAVIEDKISRIEHKLERIMNLISEGYDTAGSIARLYYKDMFEKQFFWVMSEVIGLLAHLERTVCVVSSKTDGIYHYALVRRDSNVSS
jgi:glyoxylase-like metal-dependent hydrolase (beta-lactamase superfamily II)